MCLNPISKIVVEEDKMIICRQIDLNKLFSKRRLIRKAFPELFPKNFFINLFFGWIYYWRLDYCISSCYRSYSSQFDCQVDPLEASNDWDKTPFIALRLLKIEGRACCEAVAVSA